MSQGGECSFPADDDDDNDDADDDEEEEDTDDDEEDTVVKTSYIYLPQISTKWLFRGREGEERFGVQIISGWMLICFANFYLYNFLNR